MNVNTPTNNSSPINKDDILTINSFDGVTKFFGKLGYPIDPLPYEPGALGLENIQSIKEIYQLASIGGDLRIYCFTLSDLDTTLIRSIASRLQNRFLQIKLLLIFTENWSQVSFVNVRRVYEQDSRATVKLHRVLVDSLSPTRHEIELLNGLACKSNDAESIYNDHCNAFDVDRVTDKFYREYSSIFGRFIEAMESADLDISKETKSFVNQADNIHSFTMKLLGRIMFLYFLQRKGWLANDPYFLENRFDECESEGGSFYRDVLEPVFFKYLATTDGQNSPWGHLPYLNGGLFARDYPDSLVLPLPNELFDTSQDVGIESIGLLGFFKNYNFTVEEDTPLDLQAALDPELLGRVFENLMEENQRGKTGTFYTPRPIVNYMCRESVLNYLEEKTNVTRHNLKPLLETDRWKDINLTPKEVRSIEQSVLECRIVDPAVGTGAFLVGMMQHILQIVCACRARLGVDIRPNTLAMSELKRNIIRDCLYGVDIEPGAIELAKLRLWLSLLLDLDQTETPDPLPNLDFHLMLGNSLIDSIGGESLSPPDSINSFNSQIQLDLNETSDRLDRIRILKSKYFSTAFSDPIEREEARKNILEEELSELLSFWNDKVRETSEKIEHILRVRESQSILNNKQTRELERYKTQYEMYSNISRAVSEGDQTTRPFVYPLEFAEIFESSGGFDIVIANPPYVPIHQTSNSSYRNELKKRDGWIDDLYVHFAVRAFELAKVSGVICYITSNTYFTQFSKKSPGKSELRNHILKRDLKIVAPCNAFKATVDVAIFLVLNQSRNPKSLSEFIQMRHQPANSFDRLSEEPNWESGNLVQFQNLPYKVRAITGHQEDKRYARYKFDSQLWQETERSAFWEPSERNVALYEKLVLAVEPLLKEWWPKIKDSKTYRENKGSIQAYLKDLHAGDVTLVGLVTEAGQGMRTANNGRFLAYRDDSEEGLAIREKTRAHINRWENDSKWKDIWSNCLSHASGNESIAIDLLRERANYDYRALGMGRNDLYKTVKPEHCIEASEIAKLSDNDLAKLVYEGSLNPARHWVPFRKGDKKGRRWWSDDPLYIQWSSENVRWIRENASKRLPRSPNWTNPHMYFQPGVTWSAVGNHTLLKARRQPICVFDADAMTLIAQEPVEPSSLLLSLNASVTTYVWRTFLSNSAKFELGEMRQIPIVVENNQELINLSSGKIQGKDLILLEQRNDSFVADAMGVKQFGPFNEF